MYYFGIKLYTLSFRRKRYIPSPEKIILSSVEENDLTLLKREVADTLANREIFADKIYSDFSYWIDKQQEQGVTGVANSRKSNKNKRLKLLLKEKKL